MQGPDFRRRVLNADGTLNYEEMNKIWPRLRVMGRCSPSDKVRLRLPRAMPDCHRRSCFFADLGRLPCSSTW